jgi:N-acetylglucosamine kinase-like BadF-type ATPase
MKSEFAVVVDGGASRTRCAVLTRDGRQIGYAEAGGSNYYGADRELTRQALTAAVEAALQKAGASAGDAAMVTAGMASVSPDGSGAAELDPLFEGLGFARRAVVGDLVIAHIGALENRPGIIVIAGTGSSCLGIASDGRQLKIGGWGPVYGDEGSGYNIGRMALNAAARAYDGYGPPTELVELISQALDVSDFRESLERVYQRQFSAKQMAGLAEAVQRAAAAEDAVASSILACAGDDLAAMAISVLRRLFPQEPQPLVSFAGSLLVSCEAVRTRFTQTIRREAPKARVVPPRYPPYLGAFLLACSRLAWEPGANVLSAAKSD